MGFLGILTMQPFDLGCMQFSTESQHWVISTGEDFLERCHGKQPSHLQVYWRRNYLLDEV